MKQYTYIIACVLVFISITQVSRSDNNEIINILLSPDGNKILIYKETLIEVVDSRTQQVITSLSLNNSRGLFSIWSSDSNYVAIAINNGSIQIRDINTGSLVTTLVGYPPNSRITDLIWVGNTLYSMSLFEALIIWDMVTYQYSHILEVSGIDLAVSPNGETLAIADFLRTFLVDLNTMTISPFAEHPIQLSSITWSPDGQKIVVGAMDGTISIWDLDDSNNPEITWDINTPDEAPTIADLHWNDGYLAIRQLYNDSVVILDDQTGEALDTILVENGRFIWSGNTGYYATFRNEPIQLHQYCDEITQSENVLNISQEITAGNSNAFGNTICLSPNATYTLSATLPSITGEITIIGNGATINMTGQGRVFDVGQSGVLHLKNVAISSIPLPEPNPDGIMRGGINNAGNLILENVTLQNNSAVRGGAIYNTGVLNMDGGAIQNNSASEFGGGIYNVGEMNLNGVNIRENDAPEGSGVYQGE